MSEFKFACPVCGQRMAVDSSASGAQVECPTCFQIIIVPKAPAAGSKYQLSATQYLKPVMLPPPPKPAAPPPPPQHKSAVLIFSLILVCAVLLALFIRERIVGSRPGPARTTATGAALPAANLLWTLDLANATIPDRPAAGEIHGKDFACRQAVLMQNGMLILRSQRGWQASIAAAILVSTNFFSTNAPEILSGRSFEIVTNRAGFVRFVRLNWPEGDLRVTEDFTNGFAMKLQFGNLSGNELPGKIYLCLPDEMKSYVAGSFTAEVRRFPRLRSSR